MGYTSHVGSPWKRRWFKAYKWTCSCGYESARLEFFRTEGEAFVAWEKHCEDVGPVEPLSLADCGPLPWSYRLRWWFEGKRVDLFRL